MRCSNGRFRSTVQSITEKRNGSAALADRETCDAAPANAPGILAAAKPAAGTPRMNSRRSISGTEDFVANVFEYVSGALYANRTWQDRIFILNAKYALVADVHIRLNNRLPCRRSVSITHRTKCIRGVGQVAGLKSEIEQAVFRNVFREQNRVFHVRMKDGTLLAEKVNDFYWIAALPEKVAQVTVRADFLAHSLPQFEQCARVVDDKIRVHFERKFTDAVIARKFCGFLPIRNHLFFPLPLQHVVVFRRPTIGNPIRLCVRRSPCRATGKSNNYFHVHALGQEHRFVKRFDVSFRVRGVRMDGISMATESSYVDVAVFKFLFPGFGFRRIRK